MTWARRASETRSGCDRAREADISEQPAALATSDRVTRSAERRRRWVMGISLEKAGDSSSGCSCRGLRAPDFKSSGALRPTERRSVRSLGQLGLNLVEQRLADGIDHLLDRRLGPLAHALHFLGADLIDLHAVLLKLGQGLGRLGAGILALEVAGLLRGLKDDALLGRRQTVPPALGGGDDPRAVDVVGHGQVLLHLVEFRGEN